MRSSVSGYAKGVTVNQKREALKIIRDGYNENKGLEEIAESLNAAGLTLPKNGKPWGASHVSYYAVSHLRLRKKRTALTWKRFETQKPMASIQKAEPSNQGEFMRELEALMTTNLNDGLKMKLVKSLILSEEKK